MLRSYELSLPKILRYTRYAIVRIKNRRKRCYCKGYWGTVVFVNVLWRWASLKVKRLKCCLNAPLKDPDKI